MKLEQFIRKEQQKALSLGKEESAVVIYLMHILNYSSSELFLHMNDKVSSFVLEKFENEFRLYLYENKPIQYIVGYQTFYGYDFLVDDRVLIPRFETEELVENILSLYDEYFDGSKVKVCDIGTGSGAIGITLAKEETEGTEAAIKRAKKFNEMPTSGKREIDVIYRANAKNFNKAFGTNFTWQELRTFMKQSDWENLDKKYGYKLMKKAIKSYVDKNKAEASVKAANEQHKNVKPDEVADEIVKSLAKDGLKFDMLTSGTGEFVNPDDNPFID